VCRASIIVPAYNAEKFITETLQSILAQTCPDFECLVVDDGSTDNTVAMVRTFADPRIRVITQDNFGGPARPRNVGLDQAKGDYVFIFDADDIMSPNKVELAIKALDENPQADMLFTNFTSIDDHGKVLSSNYLEAYDTLWNLIGGVPTENAAIVIPAKEFYSAIIKINFVGTSGVVLRKSALSKADRFNEALKNSDDRLFWILFTKKHNVIYLNIFGHQYRRQRDGISNQGFMRRAASKIRALEIVKDDCCDSDLKKVVIKQIAIDYAALSYCYREVGDRINTLRYALLSLKYYPNFRGLKLIIQAMLTPLKSV
jgi:glycosyltransferase involved in cell wall biosynthesis